jgi:adenosylmethionine-8-amino-7-oxononanoate aminotransferase
MTTRAAPAPVSSTEELLAFDREHVWHPYSAMTAPGPARLVESADGVRLRLADGRGVIDAMASWWCAIHGYRNPVLDAAAHRQLDEMAHVMFGGLTHRPALELARQLIDITPEPLRHVFFADSGSVSVEVAVKMTLQAQRGRGRPYRTRLLTLRGGYHGDTFAAMSVCDPVNGMHSMFSGVLPAQVFAPQPPAGLGADIGPWADEVRDLASRHAGELAGIIVEPVLQGAGGMYVYDPGCLRVLRDIADSHDLVLVFDEIATGFGRTGEMFAAEHADVAPDIMCVGKALTGGYLSLGAVLCTSRVARDVGSSESGALMHGPTFMANPLACAVAGASLDLLARRGWRTDVQRINAGLVKGLAPAARYSRVADVRTVGAVGVVQLTDAVDVARVTEVALDHGVWLRPFRDLVYTMPPYICTEHEIATICAAICATVES